MSKATINDLQYQFYDGAVPATGGGSGTGVVSSSPQIANKYATQANGNTTTAPVQFAVLANVTIATTGYYRVKATYGYGGTAEATTPDNFQMTKTNTAISSMPAPVAGANTLFPSQEFFVNCVAGDVLKIITTTAGSAGSVYKTYLTVDRMS
jgi:hypothetical protein